MAKDHIYILNDPKHALADVYELDHETQQYLYLKAHSQVKELPKDTIHWFRTEPELMAAVKARIQTEIAKLEQELKTLRTTALTTHHIPS